jgi:hypothetical protein
MERNWNSPLSLTLPNGRTVKAPAIMWIMALVNRLPPNELEEVCRLVEELNFNKVPLVGQSAASPHGIVT